MTENKYIQLIHRSLQGSLSDTEQQQFDEWLAADSSHREMANDIATGWAYAGQYVPSVKVDTENAFQHFEKAMDTSNTIPPTAKLVPHIPVVKPTNSGNRRWLSNLSRIAAAVLLLSGAFWGWNIFSNQSSTVHILAKEVRTKVVLPDQSTVLLNEGATLSYEEAFSPRQLVLTGEAFFEVTHNPANPFIILTENTQTKVLGTSFNINNKSTETVVTVFTGKVSFSERNEENKPLILLPEEKGTYLNTEDRLVKSSDIVLQMVNWQQQVLEFKDEPLGNLLPALASFYNIDFKPVKPAINNCTFTGIFDRNQIDDALESLSFGLNIEFEQTGSTITIRGEGCN